MEFSRGHYQDRAKQQEAHKAKLGTIALRSRATKMLIDHGKTVGEFKVLVTTVKTDTDIYAVLITKPQKVESLTDPIELKVIGTQTDHFLKIVGDAPYFIPDNTRISTDEASTVDARIGAMNAQLKFYNAVLDSVSEQLKN